MHSNKKKRGNGIKQRSLPLLLLSDEKEQNRGYPTKLKKQGA